MDTPDDLNNKVQARFAELPPDIKQAVESADLDSRIQAVGQKNKLHLDQIGKLQNETLLVMLGFTSTNDLVANIVQHLGVPNEQASAIANDLQAEIFAPIRESLKKLSVPQMPAPQPPPAATTPATAPKPSPAVPAVTPAPPLPATMPKTQVPLPPHPHDLTLVEKTITTPPAPSKPNNYKVDPYRELPQ